MDNIIEVEKKMHYGSQYIYPSNEQAHNACRLLNRQKTLTTKNIDDLKGMGFTVRHVLVNGDKRIEICDL